MGIKYFYLNILCWLSFTGVADAMTGSECSRSYVGPLYILKIAKYAADFALPDIAKLVIKNSYSVSVPGSYVVDYGCEALYAGFIRGPHKIPHELVKYACALKASHWVNDSIDRLNLDYPAVVKKNKYLNLPLYFFRPFMVKTLIRFSIDLLVDTVLETNEEDETDFLMDK
jgi:hypothetical protein